MSSRRIFNSVEESQIPWNSFGSQTAPSSTSALVACPLPVAAFGMAVVNLQNLYQMAYEAAVLSSLPSRYEKALIVSAN